MRRRTFIAGSLPSAGLTARRLLADSPMPMATLGKSGLQVSRFAVGGYHMMAQGEDMAVRIIRRALDLGVNFFDSANGYHNGRSDEIYGQALAGVDRQKIVLMTKCEKYSKAEAMSILEKQLRALRTSYIDLWQCHQVSEQKEADQILGPGGALEAFVQAKKEGKVRHIGFTGHRDPAVHLRLLNATDEWETIQMPVNLIDPHYLSFIRNVLPAARKKGLGVIAMKSNAMGEIGRRNVAKIEDCLRFTWSQDVDVLVSGVQNTAQIEQNVAVLKALQKMSKQEISLMLHRTKQGRYGPGVERYKKPEGAASRYPPHRDGEPA
jgi:predicted aldo/keto reductase-like oxidoreductase